MELFIEKTTNKLSVFAKKFHSFFYGPVYPSLIAVATLIFYLIGDEILGLFFFATVACSVVLLYRDLTPFSPLPFFAIMIFRDLENFSSPVPYVIFVIFLICLAFHFILYPITKFQSGKLYKPLLLLCVVVMCSGIGSTAVVDAWGGLVIKLALGPLILFAYFLFSNYLCPPKGFDLKRYFSFILVLIGVTASVQLLMHFYIFYFNVHEIDMGWANINIVTFLLIIAIPACWYLIVKNKRPIFPIISLVILLALIIRSGSQGCLGISLALIPVCAYFARKKADKKRRKTLTNVYFVFTILLLIGLSVFMLTADYVAFFNELIKKLLHDNRRIELYEEALGLFLTYPVFGAGLGYVGIMEAQLNILATYNFHSTVIHSLATMGVIGLVTYAYYYVKRFQIIFAKDRSFNVFSGLSIIMFSLYGIMDACEFVVAPHVLLLTVLLAVIETTNKESQPERLPLFMKDFKF